MAHIWHTNVLTKIFQRGKGTLRSIKGIPHIPLLIDLPLIVVYYKTNLVQKYIIFDRHQGTIDSDNNIIN